MAAVYTILGFTYNLYMPCKPLSNNNTYFFHKFTKHAYNLSLTKTTIMFNIPSQSIPHKQYFIFYIFFINLKGP